MKTNVSKETVLQAIDNINLKEMESIYLEGYNKAYQIGFNWLKNHLLWMLKNNKNKIDSICNAMGSTAFYKKDNALWTHECEDLKGYKELNDFLFQWNEVFHFTGDPIHIDREGTIETDW
jgi:hypothetical protein